MRPRFAVLGSLLAALAVAAMPTAASAAPHHNHGLTINATPNPILAGDGVTIYGQLKNAPAAGKTIVLWHHISGSQKGFTRIGATTTRSDGSYEFTREEGVVLSNRSWFVTEAGTAGHVQSRTIHERVAALVSLAASTTMADTNHAVVFSGHVTPKQHAFERVFLQEQNSTAGDDWTTIKASLVGPGSNYVIPYTWRVPGVHDVRVVFPGDDRNIRGESDSVTVTVDQTEVPDFTINTLPPIIDEGSSAKISGVLDVAGATTGKPVNVTLLARQDPFITGHRFQPVDHARTGGGGSYSFTVMPQHNTEYMVETTRVPPKRRHTAVLFEGVRDVVTIDPIPPTSTVGQSLTFTGTVNPDKARHVIELQRLGADGDYHTVALSRVSAASAYQFVWTFGTAGMKTFRVRVPGGPENVGGVSPKVTITVAPAALSTLPPAP